MLVTLGHFLNRCTLYSVQFTFILFAVLCSVSKTAGDMALKLKTIHTKIFLFFYIFLVNFVCNFPVLFNLLDPDPGGRCIWIQYGFGSETLTKRKWFGVGAAPNGFSYIQISTVPMNFIFSL